ncbi:site-specific integrase [Bacillus sp. ST24]|uniref:site-specific integrase n=1 Tax=Bacillus sp. ST24 TaxID=2978740 RepID=UPI0021D44C50|nr:site-specific integrase [Bacillus sp. ST24]
MRGSVKKDLKSGTYYFVVDIGIQPNGKRKQKRKRGFSRKQDAQAALNEVISQLNKGTFIEPSKMLFSEVSIKWLERRKREIRYSTYKTYNQVLDTHILPYLGNIKISKVNQRLLNSFVDEQYEKGYSKNYISKQIAVLKLILNFAVEEGYLKHNPAKKLKKQEEKNTVTSYWTEEEAKTFLATARTSPYYAVYLIALATGLRKGEILGMRWDAVDFENSRIYVKQILTNDGKKLEIGAKTENSLRSVEVSQNIMEELKSIKQRFNDKECLLKGAFSENNLVISSSKGTPINPRNIGRNMDLIIQKSGVRRITFHSLRHTHATLLMEKGINMKVVSERLGHADIRTTMNRYTHVGQTLQKEAAEMMGSLIK